MRVEHPERVRDAGVLARIGDEPGQEALDTAEQTSAFAITPNFGELWDKVQETH